MSIKHQIIMEKGNSNLDEQFIGGHLKAGDGYELPNEYFDKLPLRLMKRISDRKKRKAVFWFVSSSLIATCCLVLTFFFMDVRKHQEVNTVVVSEIMYEEVVFESIEEEDIIDFLVYESNY